jgi:hypothetical protein
VERLDDVRARFRDPVERERVDARFRAPPPEADVRERDEDARFCDRAVRFWLRPDARVDAAFLRDLAADARRVRLPLDGARRPPARALAVSRLTSLLKLLA